MEYIKREIVFISLFICSFYANCLAQEAKVESNNTSRANDSTEILISKIRKEYNKINSDSSKLRIVKEDRSGQSTEGGELKKFYDGDNLRKAILVLYGETGKSITEYYFANGRLFFAYERIEEYNKPIYENGTKVNKVEENRYYFNNLRLIRWINSGKMINNSLYPAKEKELLDDIKDIH